jgi:hypothetical protein
MIGAGIVVDVAANLVFLTTQGRLRREVMSEIEPLTYWQLVLSVRMIGWRRASFPR